LAICLQAAPSLSERNRARWLRALFQVRERLAYQRGSDVEALGGGCVRQGLVLRPFASPALAIYIDRRVAKRRRKPIRVRSPLTGGRKRVLVVLFVPSVERDGTTPIDQDRWVDAALEMFGRVFGGATAYPKAKGIWRDDERDGALVKDEPVVVHCYTTPSAIEDRDNLAKLGSFCRTMGRDARQGEIGLVIGDAYFAIREFGLE
jgi:hypothetical protein